MRIASSAGSARIAGSQGNCGVSPANRWTCASMISGSFSVPIRDTKSYRIAAMAVDIDVAGFERLVDPDEQLTRVGSGYQFTEGPVWSPRDRSLYFSDIPSDARWRWSERDGMVLDGSPTFKANGLAFDTGGSLLRGEQVSSCVVRFTAEGGRELIAFHHQGKYLNSPNDIVVRRRDGAIYFTDPDYGRWNDWIGQERSRDLDFRGLY